VENSAAAVVQNLSERYVTEETDLMGAGPREAVVPQSGLYRYEERELKSVVISNSTTQIIEPPTKRDPTGLDQVLLIAPRGQASHEEGLFCLDTRSLE
jgi:hypothetical protein